MVGRYLFNSTTWVSPVGCHTHANTKRLHVLCDRYAEKCVVEVSVTMTYFSRSRLIGYRVNCHGPYIFIHIILPKKC